MRLEELEGAIVVRTQVIRSSNIFSGVSVNASYCDTPIRIVRVEGGVVYYQDAPEAEVRILSALYYDDFWAPVVPEYLPAMWKDSK